MKKLIKHIHLLPIILFPVLLFAPLILSGKALFWGTPALQFIPWHVLSIEQVGQGIVPLWNPLNGMGAPLAANYQSALFYPPNWIVLLIGIAADAGWVAWAHTISICIHLVWMGIGVSQISGLMGYGKQNRIIAGLAFALCGFFVARTSFFSMIWAGAWFPWMLYAASKIAYPGCQNKSPQKTRFPVQLAVFGALQLLAGHAQLTWYSWLFLAAWLTAGGWSTGRMRGILDVLKISFPALLLSAGIAAVQLGITAEYLLLSQRSSAVDYELAMTYSFWPWRLLGFLLPDLFGNPGTGNYWGYASFWEDAVYIGILPFVLALMTLPRIWKRHNNDPVSVKPRQLIRFLWVVIIISILLALGKHTPIFPFLFKNIPTFDMFNSPARYLLWAEISLVLLAGIGLNYWKKPEGKALYWLRLATAGGFAVTLGAFLALFLLPGIQLTFIRATALCGLFALLTGALTLTHPGGEGTQKKRIWEFMVVAVVGVDLLIANWNSIPGVERQFYMPPEETSLAESLNSGRLYIHPNNEHHIKFKRFFQFADFAAEDNWEDLHDVLIPNINLLVDIPSANNFDPLVTNHYNRWMENLAGLPAGQRENWFRLMNVSVEETRRRHESNSILFKEVEGSQRFQVYGCAAFFEKEEEVWNHLNVMMESETQGLEKSMLLIQSDEIAGECLEPPDYAVKILRDDPDNTALTITSQEKGWLLMADTWYPGWRAKVNQQKVEIYRGNFLFRAVRIDEGENQVEFIYAPMSFRAGLVLSLISFALLLGIAYKRIMV